jgi:hypothetical protein
MASDVETSLRKFYGDPAKLSRALRRRYELERKVLLERAARGENLRPENDWVIEEIRSGEWERRTKRNRQNMRRDRERLAHRLKARALIVHAPERREAAIVVARAHEEGAGRRRASSPNRPDDPSPPEPEPPPVEVCRGVAAASARMAQHCERRRAKWAAA